MSKIKKAIMVVCAVILVAVQTAFPAYAQQDAQSVLSQLFSDYIHDDMVYGEADRIVYCYSEIYGVQPSDTYIESAKIAAEEMLSSERFVKPTDLQKCAIALARYGECTQELIDAAVYLNTDFAKQGLNAYIWGLIASGRTELMPPDNAVNTSASIIEYILSAQLDDDGFALTGSKADCDITCAAICALAPYRGDEAVAQAVAEAFEAIKLIQLESGGFMSMGIENCESTAQAITAAAAIGEKDWIIESGALDALLDYRCDGGFSHLADSGKNELATAQACNALTAYLQLTLQMQEQVLPEVQPAETTEAEIQLPEQETAAQEHFSGGMIKVVVVAVCATAGVILLIIWFAGGRRKPLFIVVALLCLVAGVVAAFADFSTPEEYYAQDMLDGISVTVTIDCSAALENAEKAADGVVLPESSMMISESCVTVQDGASALDALIEAARAERIIVDHIDSWSGAYVQGIAGLYEFDLGSESGWLYYVNGTSPSCAISEYVLSDGDVLTLEYTCSLGREN